MLVASLLNLDAVVEAARGDDDVAILCAGVEGAFAIDDAYVAGRIVEALGGSWDDSALAAARLAGAFARAEDGIGGGISAENIRRALDDDIAFCARESVLDLVPRVVARREAAVEIVTGVGGARSLTRLRAGCACPARRHGTKAAWRRWSAPSTTAAASRRAIAGEQATARPKLGDCLYLHLRHLFGDDWRATGHSGDHAKCSISAARSRTSRSSGRIHWPRTSTMPTDVPTSFSTELLPFPDRTFSTSVFARRRRFSSFLTHLGSSTEITASSQPAAAAAAHGEAAIPRSGPY